MTTTLDPITASERLYAFAAYLDALDPDALNLFQWESDCETRGCLAWHMAASLRERLRTVPTGMVHMSFFAPMSGELNRLLAAHGLRDNNDREIEQRLFYGRASMRWKLKLFRPKGFWNIAIAHAHRFSQPLPKSFARAFRLLGRLAWIQAQSARAKAREEVAR